jgi:DNA helicase-2/ATP-dependent DNA helicase PcrA
MENAESIADPESLLLGLNDAQRHAAEVTTGPVAIHAGAGTGKTRVIVHRVAYAVATGAVASNHVLLVTFTDKAAGEMRERVTGLGVPGVAAMTFHAAARRQLNYLWPQVHGTPAPGTLADPWPLIAPMTRRLPGGFRFTPTKDVIDAIGWLRSQRIEPRDAERSAAAVDRSLPIPGDLLAELMGAYEMEKQRRGVIDFHDMIEWTTQLLQDNAAVREQVHNRYRWFSVDEFQDTSPAQNDLLQVWLGPRQDICVVGDEDQTIYSFTGATSGYLTHFGKNRPEATILRLAENYRSTPQILTLANRLLVAPGSTSDKLRPTQADGAPPQVKEFADDETEVNWIVAQIRQLLNDGAPGSNIAILTRLNADLAPFEAALTRAGVPHKVRGKRFFDRREIRQAGNLLRRMSAEVPGADLMATLEGLLIDQVGYSVDDEPRSGQARERQSALSTWLQIVSDMTKAPAASGKDPAEDVAATLSPQQIATELDRRATAEATEQQDGIELATLHRAKGLEWQAVFLPGVEEGRIPVAQAKTNEAIAEEKRLLYVGITRAQQQLFISWASQRSSTHGAAKRKRSRFLNTIQPTAGSGTKRPPRAAAVSTRKASGRIRKVAADTPPDSPELTRLKEWRKKRAEEDAVPPYVIFHDKTLHAIIAAAPTCPDDLLAISGIGPAKLDRYGDELLAVLKDQPLPEAQASSI